MEVDSILPDCEAEVGISAVEEGYGNEAGPSAEKKDDKKETVSSAMQEESYIEDELPEKQVDDLKEAKTAATQEVENTHEVGNSAEKSSIVDSCGKKTTKVLKVRRKIVKRKVVKKSPASSALTKEALDEQEDGEHGKEVPAAQEVTKTPEAGNSAEKCSKSESSTKKNEVLKVKKKIVKKSPASHLLKTNKVLGSPKKKLENNKRELQENGDGGGKVEDAKKLNKKEDVKISGEKEVEDAKKLNEKEDLKINALEIELNEKSEKAGTSQKETSELKNSNREKKNMEKSGPSDKSKNNQRKKEVDNGEKLRSKDKNKEKFGGLIFMCSAKTKPDCFHYKVMGVPVGKKDSVLAIKPGLKLFLYDFDLRLLYGIYKASSSGGMKLEPKAFNGAFPAQVRFNIYKDCFPIPESVFRKAIKENYYEKNKFKAGLTMKQVRKLSDLFRPVGIHSTSAPVRVRSPPRAQIQETKVHSRIDEVQYRGPKPKGDAREYPLLSHGKDHKTAYPKEASRHRNEASRGLYLSENEYRTYGLRAERRNLDPVLHSSLETYPKDYDRDYHMRHSELQYLEVPSAQREIVRADHVYFNGKDYPVYSIDSKSELSTPRAILASGSERYALDPYYARQYGAVTDTLVLPSRREETYPTRNYAVDTEPVRHAADALSQYNQMHQKKVEPDNMPVSSRYSFAGPSYSYR